MLCRPAGTTGFGFIAMRVYRTTLRALAAAAAAAAASCDLSQPLRQEATKTMTFKQSFVSAAFVVAPRSPSSPSRRQQQHPSRPAFGVPLPAGNGNSGIARCGRLSSSSSSSALFSTSNKKEPPFQTWSFDKPCSSMEWSSLSEATLSIGEAPDDDVAPATDSADLVLIGVMAPPKEGKDGDDEDEDEDGSDDDEKEEEKPVFLSGWAQTFDGAMAGALTDLMTENAKTFKNGAKMGSTSPTLRMALEPGGKAKRYVLVGLGVTPKEEGDDGGEGSDDKKKKEKDPYAGAGIALGKAIATKCHAEKKVSSCRVFLPDALAGNATIVQDLSTQFYQTLYADNRYRTGAKVKKPAEDLKEVKILSPPPMSGSDGTTTIPEAIERGRQLASGIFLTKDIVNAPHNVLNSLSLADTARRIAEQSNGRLKCSILNKKECEKRGMGAYLGVARGSETEPQFIHLTYTPPNAGAIKTKKIGVVGKGLLFDTGGYNIKTSMMELMKFDCGGSAAVLGAARAVAAMQPEAVEAHFVVAACENMINDRAVVPSDILTASNGKTIEVMNTDAEGRLTLADALVFCDKEVGCESVIELSTLTGACMVSLGKEIAGVWTANDDLAAELAEISTVTGDKTWRMPMASEYEEQLESKFADLKNIGTRYGGAITAALFLQHFVSKKKPFAHIDIAGPVWSDKTGATGYGARLVAEWVRRQGLKAQEEEDSK